MPRTSTSSRSCRRATQRAQRQQPPTRGARGAGRVDLPEVGPDDDGWHLGLDSLGAAELAARVTDAGLGDVELDRLLVDRTPASIAARLRASVPDRRSPLVILNPDGTAPPIVALSGRGATAHSVQALGLVLGTDQPEPGARRHRSTSGGAGRCGARPYRAEPAGVPATLFMIGGSAAAMNSAALLDDLEVRSIGGDHRSCIELPHVAVIGERIRRLRTDEAPEPS